MTCKPWEYVCAIAVVPAAIQLAFNEANRNYKALSLHGRGKTRRQAATKEKSKGFLSQKRSTKHLQDTSS
jgi:hypothetical protein